MVNSIILPVTQTSGFLTTALNKYFYMSIIST